MSEESPQCRRVYLGIYTRMMLPPCGSRSKQLHRTSEAGSDVADYVAQFQLFRLLHIAKLNKECSPEWETRASQGKPHVSGRLWRAEAEILDQENKGHTWAGSVFERRVVLLHEINP